MHMQCGPLGKLSISRVEKPRPGQGIYISPYVAHSWVQTGTSANMQKRQYLYSSGLSLRSQEGLGFFCRASKQREVGGACQGGSGWQARARRVRGHWNGRRDQVFVKSQISGGKNILDQTGDLEPKGAWSWKHLQEPPVNWPHFIDGKIEAQREEIIF